MTVFVSKFHNFGTLKMIDEPLRQHYRFVDFIIPSFINAVYGYYNEHLSDSGSITP